MGTLGVSFQGLGQVFVSSMAGSPAGGGDEPLV